MSLIRLTFCTLFLLIYVNSSIAQFDEERFQVLEIRLEEYSKKNKKVNKEIDISI